jgi:DNA-binding SARP family transcriptional activator
MKTQPVVQVLGPTVVMKDGQSLDLGGPRQRRLLAALAIDAGEVVSGERLIDRVWNNGDLPSDPRGTLRTYVGRLRQSLGVDDVIVTESSGWRLDDSVTELDSKRFVELVEAADDPGADVHQRLALLDQALRLWRGDAYEEVAGEEWVRGEADRLNELRVTASERRYDAMLNAGMHTDALPGLAGEVIRARVRDRERSIGQGSTHV